MRSIPKFDAARAFAVVAALLLSACVSFAPRYDETLDAKSTAAFEAVIKIAAKVELGELADKSTYPATIDTYAGIVANLEVAGLRAATLPVGQRGTSAQARDRLVGLTKSCQDKVKGVAAIHKREGLAPGAGLTEAMVSTCDLAARAARELK